MYIDPNTGGVLFQALAIFLGIFSGIALLFSSKIRAMVGKIRRRTSENTQDNNIMGDPQQPPSDIPPESGISK